MENKSKLEKFISFCFNNRINYEIDFIEKDKNNVLIELSANVKKNKNEGVFFMSYDSDWRLSRYEFFTLGKWYKEKKLENLLNIMVKSLNKNEHRI